MDQIIGDADMMERAWAAIGQTPPPHINLYRDMWERAENVARAIQQYGDERAQEARAEAIEEAKQMIASLYHPAAYEWLCELFDTLSQTRRVR